MKRLTGAEVSEKIREQIQEKLKILEGRVPKLAIVRVGERSDDLSYERGARKKMEKFGLLAESFVFPDTISHETFRQSFQKINDDPEIDGILLLRPLPGQIREQEIAEMINPGKDLDGISPVNIAKVFSGDHQGFAPCTAEAVIRLLEFYDIELSGKKAVIIGRSMVVGKPLSMLLLQKHATVTICHTRTKDLAQTCREAEILITSAGRAKMVGADFVGEDAVVVDVGINVDSQGRLCGDVDFESVQEKTAMATPVPGGLGTVTTAVLAEHLVRAAVSGYRSDRKDVFCEKTVENAVDFC